MSIHWSPLLAAILAAGLCLPGPLRAQEEAAAPKIVRQGETATGYIVITAAQTDIFASPADDAASIGTAAKGDAFPLAGKQSGWYFVATSETTHGWIRAEAAATVFYPEYFAPPKMPDYTTPAPESPTAPVPPSWWYYRRRGGWGAWDDRTPGWDPLWPGIWFDRRDHRWRDRDWDDRDDWRRRRDWDDRRRPGWR